MTLEDGLDVKSELRDGAGKPAEPPLPRISICICTYRRPTQLAALIERLGVQQGPTAISELIVVDNDAVASARPVIEAARPPFPLLYDVQPIKNIALTRNRSVALAHGEWIGFLDDDELPQMDWLSKLHAAAVRFGADGVMGPVLPVVPVTAPAWIRHGAFFARARHSTGTPVPRNELRIGNALLASSLFHRLDGPFDPAFGLTGGEDSVLLKRLAHAGALFVWCDEATVTEEVGPERLCLGWLLRRAYRGGQGWARQEQASGYNSMGAFGVVRFVGYAVAALVVGLTLTVVSIPRGRTHWAGWLCKTSKQVGKLAALAGHRFEEYR
jgi:succinoglycan biosynthesis protein ExoM